MLRRKNVVKKNIIYIVIVSIIIGCLLTTNIIGATRLNGSRRLCNEYRERMLAAEGDNQRLRDTVDGCTELCIRLEQSVTSNVSTARGAIELIEQIREEVVELEILCNRFDWDDYYRKLDAYLGIKEE